MKAFYSVVAFVFCMSLLGCQTPNRRADTGGSHQPAAQSKAVRLEQMVGRLLQQADKAMERAHVSSASKNKAYDLFTAVVLLDPDNKQARKGLNNIAETYVARTMDYAERKRWSRARSALDELERYFPDHSQIPALRQSINDLSDIEKERVVVHKEAEPVVDSIAIDAAELRRKSDQVQSVLKLVANRVQETHESVMIYARTDAEGRWMYKIMKEHVPGYRIRGDIRISQNPVIRILKPLTN